MSNQLIVESDLTQLCKFESKISQFIHNSNQCYAHFEYSGDSEESYKLTVYTCNPKHRCVFIFNEYFGDRRISLLKQTLLDLKRSKNHETYVVTWINNENNQTYTS